jgi:hypothetical protein
MKIIRTKLSPEAEEVYKHLNKEAPNSKTERMILKAINQKVEFKEDKDENLVYFSRTI